MGFIFGGDTGTSYESLKKRREIADLLRERATGGVAQNMGEGIGQAGQMIASLLMDRKLAPQEDAARRDAAQQLATIQGGMGPEGITQEQMEGLGGIRGNPYAPEGVNAVIGALMRRKMAPQQQMAFAPEGEGNFGWTDPGEIPPDAMQQFEDAQRNFQDAPTDMNGQMLDSTKKLLEELGIPIPEEANPWIQGGLLNGPMSGAGGQLARGATTGPQVAQADTGTKSDATSMKLNEGQSKNLNFWNRMDATSGDVDKYAADLMDRGQQFKNAVPLVGNSLVSEGYQRGRRAGEEWLISILRPDTGAAVTPEEWDRYAPTFLPQPGDGPGMLADKTAARKRAADGLKKGLGLAEVLADELAASRQKSAPAAPSAGGDDWRTKDPSTWTDEQLKEYLQ